MTATVLDRLTPKQRRLTVGIGAGAALLLWVVIVVVPQWRAIAELRPSMITLRRQIQDTRQGIAQMAQMTQRYEQLSTELRAYPKQLARERIPGILDELADLAKAAGMAVEVIRPAAVKTSRAEERGARKGQGKTETADHLIIPIEILGRAGYHDLARFIDGVENAWQLCRVQSLSIDADRRDPERHQVTLAVNAHIAVTTL